MLRRPSSVRPWLLGVALLPCLGYLAAELYLLGGEVGFPLDDSWIHLQFARNLAAGQGLAYRPGTLVTGSTAPLWTALLSLGFLLPGSPLLWAKALGVAAHLAAVDASARLARELGVGRGLAVVAGGLVGATAWLVWASLAAMEVGLFITLSTWGMILHARERSADSRLVLSLPVLALAVLARPEGVLLLALAIADRARGRRVGGELIATWDRRRIAAGLGLACLVLLPVLLFYAVVGGSPLPNTFDTKAGYARWGVPRLQYVYLVVGILFQNQPAAALLAPAGALALLARVGTERDRGLLPALWLVSLPLAYGVLSGHRDVVGNFGRYLFPLYPVAIVLAVVAVGELRERVPGQLRAGPFAVRWLVWIGLVLLVPTGVALVRGAGRYAQSVLNVHDSDVRLARYLAPRLPPEAVLAVNDIGAFGYFLPNPLVDLAGIVTPEVHPWARRALAEGGDYRAGLLAYLRHARPDYVAVFPEWFGAGLDTPDLVPLLRLEVPDNITMGGDQLVLYATAWTRHPLAPEIP